MPLVFAGVLLWAVWVVLKKKQQQGRYLCPDCQRYLDNTCSVPDRPYMTNCRCYEEANYDEEEFAPFHDDENDYPFQ